MRRLAAIENLRAVERVHPYADILQLDTHIEQVCRNHSVFELLTTKKTTTMPRLASIHCVIEPSYSLELIRQHGRNIVSHVTPLVIVVSM
jgi:hypothetical protein